MNLRTLIIIKSIKLCRQPGTKTGLCLIGSFPREAFGGMAASCLSAVNGGAAVLYGGFTVGILGDSNGPCPSKTTGGGAALSGILAIGLLGEKDGTSPLISWGGKGAAMGGGNASGGAKSDPVLSMMKLYQTISKSVNKKSSLCKLPFG